MSIKKSPILILLLIFNSSVFGQFVNNFKTTDHVHKDWLNRGACDTLYYTEGVSSEVLNSTIKLISASKTFPLYVLYNGKETKPLTITPIEQSYLINELIKLKTFKWPSAMFPKSKRIIQNNINSVFTVTGQFSEEKYHACSLIYSFSKPIYFRNGTICLYIDQEIYSKSNTRLFTQFFSKINGAWEEYADVYTQLAEEFTPVKPPSDNYVSTLVGSLIKENSPVQTRSTPEQLPDFGKRVVVAFKTQNKTLFAQLYPTLEEQTANAKQLGVSPRKRSTDFLEAGQALGILNFKYKCSTIIDTAKLFQINWANVAYTNVKKHPIQLPVKDINGLQITVTNVIVEFMDANRKFQIELENASLIGNSWKATSISGIREIKNE